MQKPDFHDVKVDFFYYLAYFKDWTAVTAMKLRLEEFW